MNSFIEEIRKYKTADGKEFDSREAAALYVEKVRLAEAYVDGWKACASHVREHNSIQFTCCPRCGHEFEGEIIFEALECPSKSN